MSSEPDPRVTRARNRLGVGPKAGAAEIRRAFRLLSKDLHPDRGGDPEAFDEVQAAYDLLRSTQQGPVERWFLDEDEPPPPRMVYDSRARPARRSFQQIFTEAMRGASGADGPSGSHS